MTKKPGVMIYFSIAPAINALSAEDRGLLFSAILEYARNGTEPVFDNALSIAWLFIKPMLDADEDRYIKVVRGKSNAAMARWTRSAHIDAHNAHDEHNAHNEHNEHYEHDAHDANACSSMHIMPNTNTDSVSDTVSVSKPKTDSDFKKFWDAYPRKQNKKRAYEAFLKVDVDVSTLITAIEKQKKSDQWKKENGKYIPHPGTWLNGCRWNDETEENSNDNETSKFEGKNFYTV